MGFAAPRSALYARQRQLLTAHAYARQPIQRPLRHVCRQPHEAVILADLHAIDLRTIEIGFVGNCADDIARLRTVCPTYCEPIGFLRPKTSAFSGTPGFVARGFAARGHDMSLPRGSLTAG